MVNSVNNLLFRAVLTIIVLLQDVSLQQTTTLSVYPEPTEGLEEVAGELLGTAANETTYAVSGIHSGESFTETIVHGSTHVSYLFVFESGNATVAGAQQCGFESDSVGSCTRIISGASGMSETTIISQSFPTTISFAGIPVSSTAENNASSSTNSDTSEVAGPTDSDSSDSDTFPLLPALFVVTPVINFLITLW